MSHYFKNPVGISGTLALPGGASSSDNITFVVGKSYQLKEGSNARMGIATLAAGIIVVNNTSVTANTRIFLSRQNAGGTMGNLACSRVAGSVFTIASDSASDTSIVAWQLVEPAP